MIEPSGFLGEDAIRLLLADERSHSLVWQPVVDLRRGVAVGYEALSRFALDRPTPPDVVFASADRFGLGAELEAIVVERALALWSDVPENCFLSINVDPEHLLSRRVFDVLASRRSLAGIVFELTEQRRIVDLHAVARCAGELRKLGASFAVDDAGAGYSGLQQILALRPQFLKLDRALVTAVHSDEAKRAMVEMMGELAQRLDAWIVAEGIEEHAELHTLAQLGVPLGQGYYLCRPAPPWAALTPEVERALDALPREARTSDAIDPLVEPCSWCGPHSNWPEQLGACLRLESNGRPLALRCADASGERIRESHEFLRVKRGSSLVAVALRCTARPEPQRWDPIVCVDDLGHFEGVVHMHKLIWALARREIDQEGASEAAFSPEVEAVLDEHH